MTDTKPSLTAAELRAIGERVTAETRLIDVVAVRQVVVDRARLYAALERLTAVIVKEANDPIEHPGWWINIGGEWWDEPFATKDAAIDALLGQGGGE